MVDSFIEYLAREDLADGCVSVNYILCSALETKCTFACLTVIWPSFFFIASFDASGTRYPFFAAFFIGISFATVNILGFIITVIVVRVNKYWFKRVFRGSEDDVSRAFIFSWGRSFVFLASCVYISFVTSFLQEGLVWSSIFLLLVFSSIFYLCEELFRRAADLFRELRRVAHWYGGFCLYTSLWMLVSGWEFSSASFALLQ